MGGQKGSNSVYVVIERPHIWNKIWSERSSAHCIDEKQIIVTLVSEVAHKSVIEVNEEGSEAAAVTAVVVSTRSRRPRPTYISMIFDRPFYFIIQDKTHNLNLFMGRIVDPSGVHNLWNPLLFYSSWFLNQVILFSIKTLYV